MASVHSIWSERSTQCGAQSSCSCLRVLSKVPSVFSPKRAKINWPASLSRASLPLGRGVESKDHPRMSDAESIRVAVEELLSTAGYERAAADPDEPFACGAYDSSSLSAAEAGAVAELRELLKAEVASWPAAAAREGHAHMDDFTLLRFVQARPAGTSAAAAMFRESMAWRSSDGRGVGRLFAAHHARAPPTPTNEAGRAHFYGGFAGFGLSGEPLLVERLGCVDLAGIAREGEPLLGCVLDSYVVYLETAFRAVRAASAATGRLVKATIVVDASEFGFSTLRHVGQIKTIASIGPPAGSRCPLGGDSARLLRLLRARLAALGSSALPG